MAYDWELFGVTLAIDFVIFNIALFVFNWLRSREKYRRIFAPRYYAKAPGYRRPKPLPTGLNFGWARTLYGYTEDEILAVAGYDGLAYLNIFKFGMQLFTILTLLLCILVLPVNWTGDLVDENKEKNKTGENEEDVEVTDFDKVTMANVEDESSRLWVHLIASWLVTIITLSLLFKYHKAAVNLRIEFLASTKKGENSHTIFVTDIPGVRFGHPLDRLMQSWLFKFLPKGIKTRIQSAMENLSNMASAGMGAIGDMTATAVNKGREAISDVGARVALLESAEDGALETFARPVAGEITDMQPAEWIRTQLSHGLSHERAVEEMYRQVFPEGEVACANMVFNTTSLEPLVKKLNKAVETLEDILDQIAYDIRQGNESKPRKTRIIPLTEGKWAIEKWGKKPIKVHTTEYLVLKIRNLKIRIQEEQGKALMEVTGSAFVGFQTRWSQVVGASAFFHHFEEVWNAQAAPRSQEIVWENLKWRSWERNLRRVIVWVFFILLCAFFIIPITAIQAMIEVDRLEDYDVIGDIVKFPIVASLLQAVIPNLVLTIFLALLPMILGIMNHYQGFISRSAIDSEVTRKYFIFLIITVFMANFTARTFLSQLEIITEEPGEIVDALGSAAPQASNFFLYFILTQALISGAIEMLQIPRLVISWLLTTFAGTRRAKDRVWQAMPLKFGSVVSRHTLVLFLGLVFSIVNPFILPVTLVYFIVMMLYNRYSLLYIFKEDYQSGGEVWTQVYEHVIAGLIFHHLMMLGILGLKRFPYALLILPLIIFTLAFKIYVDGQFKRPLTLLSLRAARDLDHRDQELEKHQTFEEEGVMDMKDAYKNECFTVDWEEIDAVLNEVPRVEAALNLPQEEGAAMMKKLNIREHMQLYPVDSFALSKSDIDQSSKQAPEASGE